MSLMISLRNKSLLFTVFLLGSFISHMSYAEDAQASTSAYIELLPSFVVNNVGDGSRLKYIKTNISLRTNENQKATVEANMPLIRDALVMFLSSRTMEQVTGAIAREETRKEGAAVVNKALQEEIGLSPVKDILFSSFVTQ